MIFIYRISRGLHSLQSWWLTSYEKQLPVLSNIIGTIGASGGVLTVPTPYYLPTAGLAHSGLRLDSETQSGEIEVTLPLDHAVSLLWAGEAPAERYYIHIGVKATEATAPTVWYSGFIASAKLDGPVRKLKCQPATALLDRTGNARTYARTCGHALYRTFGRDGQLLNGCGADYNELTGSGAATYWRFREDGLLTGAVGRTATVLTVPEAANQPDGYFNLGLALIAPTDYALSGAFRRRAEGVAAVWGSDMPAGGVRRSIFSHVGSQIVLDTPTLRAIAAGARVTLYAGCDQQRSTCSTKFNQRHNFGGYDYSDGVNPFEAGIKK